MAPPTETAVDREALAASHEVLAEFEYPEVEIQRGYANRSLQIDLTTKEMKILPVDEGMKRVFVGGRGFGLYYLWHSVTPQTRWNDPENAVVIASGPLGGTTSFPGSGKSLVVSISPATGIPIDSNVGGHFGPLLKFSGWDALILRGKTEEDVVIYIDGNARKVQILRAPLEAADAHLISEQLTEFFADNDKEKREISVVSAGSGAEHSYMGCLNFSWFDWRRGSARIKQAGRGGIGTVFRDKKIKALVVKRSDMLPTWTIHKRHEPAEGGQ